MRATFRFYAELNDFLPRPARFADTHLELDRGASVKDMIESLGVPHTEIDVILVNGESKGFDYKVRDGDRVAVYPVFETLDVTPLVRLRPRPLRVTRFVADIHLGRLARYLRLMGFDTAYGLVDDEALAHLSRGERRILLTRDRGLLKRKEVTHGCLVRATVPRQQLLEVSRRFDLRRQLAPLSRCATCNGRLEEVAGAAVSTRVPPRAREHARSFRRCTGCGQVYWEGTHSVRIRQLAQWLEQELAQSGTGSSCDAGRRRH